ncbi:hypothetical protein FKW77_007182 [Venturia effusa]|uniref:Protein-S-isoprenylcysteine O-methyltransferase n=1 Tax=Venturia effusa TaxID=50376 RepID=A0A517LJ45_9PEZI|nr:hypothetical protein FKW77_007182 [Venturia effusa]
MATIHNPTLVLANLAATYLGARAYKAPNPPPAVHDEADTILRVPAWARSPGSLSANVMFFSLAQTYLVARGASPTASLNFFPHLENVHPRFLTWNRYSATCLGAICVSGLARIAAYRALGRNFTFQLAKPTGLKTDGIYKYVQHPSYLPLIVVSVANMAYWASPDGVVGAWLSKGLVEKLNPWKGWALAAWTAMWCGMIAVRVRDEEGMLKRIFGEEWEAWHKKTARFVPFIF